MSEVRVPFVSEQWLHNGGMLPKRTYSWTKQANSVSPRAQVLCDGLFRFVFLFFFSVLRTEVVIHDSQFSAKKNLVNFATVSRKKKSCFMTSASK